MGILFMKKSLLLFPAVLIFSCCVIAANEDAPPVVDLSGGGAAMPINSNAISSGQNEKAMAPKQELVVGMPDTSNLTDSQRIAKLEEQIAFLQQQNLARKIAQLQQTIQDLRGLIEIQGHTIQTLQNQQRSQYADIDSRLSSLSAGQTKRDDSETDASSFEKTGSSQTASSKELQLYESAFKLVKAKKYEQGMFEMNSYLKQYPEGHYAANAHFWLGELYMIAGNSKQGKQELQTVISKFPNSDKAPDVLLKLGTMAYENSQYQEAKRHWQMLINKYPQSSAAKVAKPYLAKLKKGGI